MQIQGLDLHKQDLLMYSIRKYYAQLALIPQNQVSLPFLVLHGGDDKVTEPSVSKLIYEKASSSNKSFKLYPGMWHSLSRGETAENTEIVFSDIIKWLDEKVEVGNARLERELKSRYDIPHTDSFGKTVHVA